MKFKEKDQVNGDKLRQLREERGWDVGQLSRLSSLSVAQVQALESGETHCFYSAQIKNNAARKVARLLGVAEEVVLTVEAPESERPEPAETLKAPEATKTPLAAEPARPAAAVHPGGLHAKTYFANWVGYMAMALSLLAAVAWWGLRPSPTATRPPEIAAPVVTHPIVVETEIRPANLSPAADPMCPFDADMAVFEARPSTPSARTVSLMLYKAGWVCVQDSTGKVWQEEIKPWVGRNFLGEAPWKLYSPVFPHADVYFQGEKIKLSTATSQTVGLQIKEASR